MDEFNLEEWLPHIRKIHPQVNLEKTRVVCTDSMFYEGASPEPVLTGYGYRETGRLPGFKATLWRLVGDALKHDEWYKRGVSIRHVPTAYMRSKTFKLEMYRLGAYIPDRLGDCESTTYLIAMAYDGETDTLFVSRERTSDPPPSYLRAQ